MSKGKPGGGKTRSDKVRATARDDATDNSQIVYSGGGLEFSARTETDVPAHAERTGGLVGANPDIPVVGNEQAVIRGSSLGEVQAAIGIIQMPRGISIGAA